MDGWFFGISGKSLLKNGPTIFDKKPTAPALSPIFINPRNNDITPMRPNDICTPDPAASNTPSIIVLKILVSPNATSFTSATINAIKKNATQMKFKAMNIPG
jgi:hypothetical protein